MSRNGSGVYSLPAGNPVVTGTTISSSWANTTLSDIATALTGSVAADGQTAMTGNLQMGNNKVTGLAVATATGDALSYNQAATVTTLTTTGNVTIGGTLTLTGGLTLNGDVTVGDSSADTLTVNATSTFAAGATFSSTFAANGGATLGDASGDALTINSSAVSIPNGLNFDSNTFVIDATNNRVGVGTASPTVPLDVNGATYLRSTTNIYSGTAGAVNSSVLNFGSAALANAASIYSFTGTSTAGNLILATAQSGTGTMTERLRIDYNGNVGIGTSSPSTIFDVSATAPTYTNASTVFYGRTSNGTYSGISLHSYGDALKGGVGSNLTWTNSSTPAQTNSLRSSGYIEFANSTTAGATSSISFGGVVKGTTTQVERMVIDSSGNLGIGVTPSAWSSSYRALEVNGISLMGSTATNDFMSLGVNFYFNGTNWIYKSSEYSTRYYQVDGTHQWFTAPSGTAGNAITFTQAMTLDADGDLMLGRTSSSNYRAQITGSSDLVDIAGTSVSAQFHNKTADIFMIGVGSGDGIAFATNGNTTERARITSDGYLRMASGSLGIQFGGDTAAANALDDYEEGTFTPTVYGTTTAGTGTYSSQVGRYTKIGNVVYFYAFIGWTAHTGTGNLNVTSLPFTSVNATDTVPIINIVGSSLTFTGQLYGSKTSNSINIEIRTFTTNASTAAVAMDTLATLIVTGFYYV